MGKYEKKARPQQAQRYAAQQSAPVARRSKKKKKSSAPLVLGLVAAIAVLAACVVGFLMFRDDGKIKDDVYIAGINIGGLTREQAREALKNVSIDQNMNIRLYTRGDNYPLYTTTYDPSTDLATDIYGKPIENAQDTTPLPTEETPVTDENAPVDENGVPYILDKTLCLPAEDVEITLDMAAAVEEAYLIGRETKGVEKDGRIEVDVQNYITVNDTYIREVLVSTLEDTTCIGTETRVSETTTTITDKNGNPQTVDALEIDLGTMKRDLDITALYNEIISAYTAGRYDLQYIYQESLPEPCDLDGLYAQYNCVAPVNAVCDEDTYEITDGRNGFGFRMKDAVAALEAAKPGDSVVLTLCELEPDFTAASLEKQLFCDVLSSFDSKHSTYNPARTENLRLACAAIDGTIVKPGETFSFNNIVGERTADKGYGYANVYVGGRDAEQLGGGICQVASVLFYCTIKADLEVVEREEHMYAPGYVPLGMDATIYWGSGLDYVWRNNTTHPIRVDASVSDGYVHVAFIGTNTKNYTVELDYEVTAFYEAGVKTINISPSMANYDKYKDYDEGDVIQTAYDGCKVTTYRYKYDLDGNLIEKEIVCYSEYYRRDKEVAHIVDDDEEETTEPTEKPTEKPTETTEKPTETTTEPPTTEAPTTEPPTTEPPTTPPDGGDGSGG